MGTCHTRMGHRHHETTYMGAVMNGTTIVAKDMAITTKGPAADHDGAQGEAVAAGDISGSSWKCDFDVCSKYMFIFAKIHVQSILVRYEYIVVVYIM